MEKNQTAQTQSGQEVPASKKAKDSKLPSTGRKNDVLMPRGGDQELLKSLGQLKAITLYGASRSLGVNASVAKVVLTSLESKGLVKKIGGFSGHYVWAAAS